MPAPACAEARLRVGDVEVATAQASDRGGARAYLIDGSGARCYHERVVEYGVTGVSFSPPKEQRFRPARIHALGVRVDDFLKQAPETVKVKFSEGFPSRGEVTEVPARASRSDRGAPVRPHRALRPVFERAPREFLEWKTSWLGGKLASVRG